MIIGFNTQIMPEMAARTLCRSARLRTQFCGVLQKARYDYDAEGDLVQVTDRGGAVAREFRYENPLMMAHRDRGEPWHTYVYEAFEPGARVTEQRNEDGLTYTFAYHEADAAHGTTVVVDSLGREDIYHFEGQKGLRRLVRHKRADGSTVQRRYDCNGYPFTLVDPLGRQTVLWHDRDGRLTSTVGAAGQREEMGYNSAGHLDRLKSKPDRLKPARFPSGRGRGRTRSCRRHEAASVRHDGAERGRVCPPCLQKRVSRPFSAISAARSMARALFWVSCHSASGSESATRPPPAWT
jgi:YD repeat-containing protein